MMGIYVYIKKPRNSSSTCLVLIKIYILDYFWGIFIAPSLNCIAMGSLILNLQIINLAVSSKFADIYMGSGRSFISSYRFFGKREVYYFLSNYLLILNSLISYPLFYRIFFLMIVLIEYIH
jgi:hypothetical protein